MEPACSYASSRRDASAIRAAVCVGDPEGCITWLSTVRTIMSATKATRCAPSRGAAIASRPDTIDGGRIDEGARVRRQQGQQLAVAAVGGRHDRPEQAVPAGSLEHAARRLLDGGDRVVVMHVEGHPDEREEALQLVGHHRLGEGRLRADLVVDRLPADPDLLREAAHGHRRPAVSRGRLDGGLDDAPRIVVASTVAAGRAQPAPLMSRRRALDGLEVDLVAHAAVRAAPVVGDCRTRRSRRRSPRARRRRPRRTRSRSPGQRAASRPSAGAVPAPRAVGATGTRASVAAPRRRAVARQDLVALARAAMFARLMSPSKCASTRGSITRRQTAGTIASRIIPAYPVGSTGDSS